MTKKGQPVRFSLLGGGDLAREGAKIPVGTTAESRVLCENVALGNVPDAIVPEFTKSCAGTPEVIPSLWTARDWMRGTSKSRKR